jgi:pilus assembly protein Flp/PilA
MQKILTHAKRFIRDDEGATMVEYGLMVALIAVVCIAAVTLIGTRLNTAFSTIANSI